MTFTKYWQVVSENSVRFASVYKIDAEFFLRRLLKKLSEANKKPTVEEVAR